MDHTLDQTMDHTLDSVGQVGDPMNNGSSKSPYDTQSLDLANDRSSCHQGQLGDHPSDQRHRSPYHLHPHHLLNPNPEDSRASYTHYPLHPSHDQLAPNNINFLRPYADLFSSKDTNGAHPNESGSDPLSYPSQGDDTGAKPLEKMYHVKSPSELEDPLAFRDEDVICKEYTSHEGKSFKSLEGFQPLTFLGAEREKSTVSVKVIIDSDDAESKEDAEMRDPTPVTDDSAKDDIKVSRWR